MQETFSKLGIKYSETLRFEKKKVREKEIQAWKKNRDPKNSFLARFCEEEWKAKKMPKISVHPHSFGFGVFAEEDIGTHRYIGEYTGVVRKRSLFSIFTNHYMVEYPTGFETLQKYVIDAKQEGNFTRFFNHSKFPNLEMRSSLFSDGLIHMVFITKKLIRKGDELTMHYGKKFWFQSFQRPR